MSTDLSERGFARDRELVEFFCECGARDCVVKIPLSVAEYEVAHAAPDRFTIAPGHETRAIERVLERHDRYEVVEKLPRAEAFAGGPR